MTWNAVVTSPGAEKRVRDGFAEHGLETFLPMERVWRTLGRKREHDRPLIRGYVFVRLGDRHDLVHDITGALRVVSVDGHPAEIPSCFVVEVTKAWDRGDFDKTLPRDKKGKIKRALDVGDEVRINGGLYFGYSGKLLRLNGRRKAKVLVAWMRGQQVPTDIDLTMLEAA